MDTKQRIEAFNAENVPSISPTLTIVSYTHLSTLMKLAMLYGVSTDFLRGMPQKKEQATRKT